MREQIYIVRIYRRTKDASGRPVVNGVVESPESGRQEIFHDINELISLLTRPEAFDKPRKQGRKNRNAEN
jgi:hypothetical protein